MNRQTLNTIDRVINFVANLSDSQKQTPLRMLEIGYDIYKEPGLKEFRRMTVGEFFSRVISYNNIPRKVINIVDALLAVPSVLTGKKNAVDGAECPDVTVRCVDQVKLRKKTLPHNHDQSFLEQSVDVFNTLITAMTTINKSSVQCAERLRLAMDNGLSDKEIAVLQNKTNECVRLARTTFQSDIISGIVPKELSDEYMISDDFVARAGQFASAVENQSIDFVKANFGRVGDNRLRFILKAFGFTTLRFDSAEIIVASGNKEEYRRIAEDIRLTLKKEFDYTPLYSLFEGLDENARLFVFSYLDSMPDRYEFNGDKTAVRMIGDGLQKITRIARIIFEADRLIDKEEIARLYSEQYVGKVPAINPTSLREMGFAPQNKTGKWKFGVIPAKLQDIIRQTITPERPIATLKTIMTAASKVGLDYPICTIRTYITDIATPENKQNDLFCLKGYCHLYPNYSWRRYNQNRC